MAAKPPPGVIIVKDHVAEVQAAIVALTKLELLVGFPDETADRKETPDDQGITNAALGYIHDRGAPEVNIPARPFMEPGVLNAEDDIAEGFHKIGQQVLKSRNPVETVVKGFIRVGLKVQYAIRAKINEGIPPPLSEWTLRNRAQKGRKGAKEELANRAKGVDPSTQLAKPLIDTGQLRNAVNFVIRPRKPTRR